MSIFQLNYKSFLTLILVVFVISCKPPKRWKKNKAPRYKSTQKKRKLTADDTTLTYGTFVSIDPHCKHPNTHMIRFNQNQTVQISSRLTHSEIRLIKIDDTTFLNHLDDKVSYYFYKDENNTVVLERFEYRDAPWWNVFVTTDLYIVEKFKFDGHNTLVNQEKGRFTRFCKQYRLDTTFTKNFQEIENEFVDED